jgi:hypothetical protein
VELYAGWFAAFQDWLMIDPTDFLNLYLNDMVGSLPSNIGLLTALKVFALAEN